MKRILELEIWKNKWIKRVLLLLLFLCLLLIGIVDWRLETHGVPERGIRMIRDFCEARGYRFHVRKLCVGMIRGINASGLQLDGGLNNPSIRAEEIHAEFSVLKLFRGILLPFDISIGKASVIFPFFPEYGEEGQEDSMSITDLNAELTGIPGKLRVSRASGYLFGIRFQSSGTVDNLLHYSGARGLDSLRSMLFPLQQQKDRHSSAYQNFIRSIPLSIRSKIIYSLRRMELKEFNEKPDFSVVFHLDLSSFKHSSAEAYLSLPSFRYGNLQLKCVEETISLTQGQLSIDKLKVLFQDGGFAEADGRYDSEGQRAGGSIRGKCSPGDILRFFDESFQNEIASRVHFGEQMIGFHGTIDNFSLAGHFLGKMDLLIPYLKLDHLTLRNADISLSADSSIVTGIIHSAEVNGSGTLSGNLRFENGTFHADLKGKLPQKDVIPVIPPEISSFAADIRLAPDKMILFTGDLQGNFKDIASASGRFDFSTGGISIRNILIRKLSASLRFSPDQFHLSSIHAEIADGTRVSGGLSCYPDDRRISAEIVCSGAPYKLLDLLGGSHREFIRVLTRGIIWPQGKDSIEVSASLYADYGKNPFSRISGSVAARDFTYEKIPFRYGAARFIVDADGHLILPDAVLETKEGKMYITAEYTPGPDENSRPEPGGKLNFFVISSMSGNDLIRSIYPLWKSEYIDFPESVHVESNGVIDYAHPEKTHFTASVTNGTCICHKLRIEDIDTTLRYQNNNLSFYNAGGTFAEGRLLVDYSYNFDNEKGKAAVRLSGANLKSLLENFGQKKVEPEYRNAMFNASLSTDVSYNQKDELLLNGSGGFTLTGSNLWTVPIFGSLLRLIGKVWSLESFGSITKVDGSFALAGDRMVLKKFRSNGGFVALNANGFYRWQNDYFDVNVRAELLRNALPFDAMSHILSPVSWIMEQKLKGNFNTYQWEQTKK